MLLFLMLIFVGLAAIFASRFIDTIPVSRECKMHKWEWEKQPDMPELEYLRCRECGRFPGSEVE